MRTAVYMTRTLLNIDFDVVVTREQILRSIVSLLTLHFWSSLRDSL